MNVEKKQIFYYLPLDFYGQPNGNVEKIELTEKDFLNYKKNGSYIFDNEADADWRAQC